MSSENVIMLVTPPNEGGEEERPLTPIRRRAHSPILRSSSVPDEIRLACLKGNLETLEELVKKCDGSLLNEFFEDGWSPLMIAVNGANAAVVKFLLMAGADPNKCRKDGFSPLMAALTSAKGKLLVQECVQLLIDAGANVNARSSEGISPILLAVKDNRGPIVDLLIFHGANPLIKDNNGRTPFQVASEKKFDKIIQTLNKWKADNVQMNQRTPSPQIPAILDSQIENSSNQTDADAKSTRGVHDIEDVHATTMCNKTKEPNGKYLKSLQELSNESITSGLEQHSVNISQKDVCMTSERNRNGNNTRSAGLLKISMAIGLGIVASIVGVYCTKVYGNK